MASEWSIICVFLVLCCFSYVYAFPVPLLIWSTKSLDVDDEILAGHTLSYEEVQLKYLDKLKTQTNTVCVFVQNKLSIDDFATYQSSHLNHLKDVLTASATSIVLPSVLLEYEFDQDKSPNKLVEYFEKGSRGTVISLTASDVPHFSSKIKQLKKDGSNIIVVHLPKAEVEKDSPERNLAASDEVIGKVLEKLSAHFPDYIGLLTANMPRDDVLVGLKELREVSTTTHVRARRDAESELKLIGELLPCNQTGILVRKNETMLYFKNIYLHSHKNSSDSLFNKTNAILPSADVNVTGSRNGSIALSFPLSSKDFKNGSSVTIRIVFTRTALRWSCVNISITGHLEQESFDNTFNCTSIDTPIDKSYVCQENTTFKHGDTGDSVMFEGLQVQPYGANNTFANSYDCIGFFTPPIWMGLISVSVLVAILYGGMLSLLSIRSMDRFDNPKDPTINILGE